MFVANRRALPWARPLVSRRRRVAVRTARAEPRPDTRAAQDSRSGQRLQRFFGGLSQQRVLGALRFLIFFDIGEPSRRWENSTST
jgi:hypothetical protein